MRVRIKSISAVVALTAFLACIFSLNVYADAPYRSFVQTQWMVDAAAPDAYLPVATVSGIDMGSGELKEPQDMYITKNGDIYILDTGNSRLVIVDKDFKTKKILTDFIDARGVATKLNGAKGVFVDKQGYIYIADTANARVIKCDENGKILQAFYKPEDKVYTSATYSPTKVLVDNIGMVYVISDTVFQGAILFNPDGTFNSFYGGARVQVTMQLLADRFWKKILNKNQREGLARYVPIEYTNFDIDDKGFVYTCTQATRNNVEQLRKLNALGDNIYPKSASTNFGDVQRLFFKTQTFDTTFVDITVDDKDFMMALDITRCRIYVYDQETNQLMTFGTEGDQLGAFQKPLAIDTFGDRVYVLDSAKGTITYFEPTEYGALIREAVTLYNDGLYEQAMEPWKKVLALNSNYELAYEGMGQAMLKTGKFAEAVKYFRESFSHEEESLAFKKLRAEVMRDHFSIVILVALLLLAGAIALTSKKVNAKLRAFIKRKAG